MSQVWDVLETRAFDVKTEARKLLELSSTRRTVRTVLEGSNTSNLFYQLPHNADIQMTDEEEEIRTRVFVMHC